MSDRREARTSTDLALRIGEMLLVCGAAATDTAATMEAVTRACGLHDVAADVTFNDLMLRHQPNTEEPVTIQVRRVTRHAVNHGELIEVDRVDHASVSGTFTRDGAREEVARIVSAGPRRRASAVALGWSDLPPHLGESPGGWWRLRCACGSVWCVSDSTVMLVGTLAVALALGAAGRALLRSRVRLSWSDSVVAGLLGAVVGSVIGGLLPGGPHPWFAGFSALLGTGAVLLVLERLAARRRQVRGTVASLVRAGESAQVEFKSSARYNRYSGKRDERLEHAVAKTLAGFLNAEGGVLLIGVADDGSITGIEADYALLKAPDRDRFELWLRDMLTKTIGVVAMKDLRVEFDASDDHDVCIVTAAAARRPVFVHGTEGHDATLFVRLGNATRALDVEEALTYCVDRWGRRTLRGAGSARGLR